MADASSRVSSTTYYHYGLFLILTVHKLHNVKQSTILSIRLGLYTNDITKNRGYLHSHQIYSMIVFQDDCSKNSNLSLIKAVIMPSVKPQVDWHQLGRSGPMSDEKYYENDHIWSSGFEHSSDEIERLTAIKNLMAKEATSVLDVGCGNGHFVNSLLEVDAIDRVCGVDRSRSALSYVKSEKYEASADNLPFEDDEFDLVCAFEVLEHLPIAIYESAIREITRVAKKQVLISVPFMENQRSELISCPKCFCAFNRSYHLRRFDRDTMRSLFDDLNHKPLLQDIRVCGTVRIYWGLSMLKRVVFGFRNPSLPPNAVCPHCGFTSIQVSHGNESMHGPRLNPPSSFQQVGQFLRKMLPSSIQARWVIASYAFDPVDPDPR